jgi:hypothetical protein
MKGLFFIYSFLLLFINTFSQIKFSEDVKRFIDYDTPVLVLKHALLLKGTGEPARSNQTVIIEKGKISWVGDDVFS